MKKTIAASAFFGLVLSLVIPATASAYSVAPSVYSADAVRQIVTNQAILGVLPRTEAITRIEQVSGNANLYEVSAGNCTVTIQFSAKQPPRFIGNGLPHDPAVVDSTGCQQ
jgi:hypothetical protein